MLTLFDNYLCSLPDTTQKIIAAIMGSMIFWIGYFIITLASKSVK